MKIANIKICFILLCTFVLYVQARAQKISGTVTDDKSGKPLQSVSITNLKTKKGTQTDSLGKFSLDIQPNTKISFVITGYGKIDTLYTGGNNISIIMHEQQEELDEVVIVSSSRTNSRIEDLPTKVEVLGAEEVHEENGIKPGNIASLLGDIAGIQIQQTNAATGNADMRIQGLQGKYTQILRDGMPLFGGFSGSFGILQIPPLDLQQIELVKGSASTLYGGGAIAGMLNLISKKPKLGKPEASFTINRSTLQESNINTFFSGRNKQVGYTIFAGGTNQDAVDVNKDGFSDVPSVKNIFIHPRFFIYGSDKSTVAIGYTFNSEDRNGGDMLAISKNPNTSRFFIRNQTTRHTADIIWEEKLANNAQFTLKGSTNFSRRDISTNVFGMKANQQIWYTEAAYSKKTEHHNWVVGINFNGDKFNKVEPDSTQLQNVTTNTIGFFGQDDWKFNEHFTLQAGIRYDVHSKYGNFLLPRLSLMYKVNREVTMRIGGGLGYKTPVQLNGEIDERNYRYITPLSNNLEAEKSVGANYDVNYKTKLGKWKLTVNQTFFFNRIDKPLLLVSLPTITPPTYYAFTNQQAPLQTVGFETYVQATKDALELYLGYVYTNAKRKYDITNTNLPLIARNKLATIVAYEFSHHLRAGIEASYTGKQFLDNGQTTEPYLFGAAMMRYNIGKVSLVLNCENLLDYRQNKKNVVVFPPLNNPTFPEIWAPLDGRVANFSIYWKL
jgi:iron complex outermembrane receptor protein/outer membrane receptor for ferrienterochelin and colicins